VPYDGIEPPISWLQIRRIASNAYRAINGSGKQELNLMSLAYETNVETVSPFRYKSGGDSRI
jgi:hypothetical protein